jgi:hypothetical protein
MSKKITRAYYLVDDFGTLWVEANLSVTRFNAIVREYKRQNINLTERVA